MDVTPWLDWFLDCLGRSFESSERTPESVLYKARLWEHANRRPVNERQRLVLNRMLHDFRGQINSSKYAKLAKCSTDTALRDIRDLVRRELLIQNPAGGRSCRSSIPPRSRRSGPISRCC